MNVGALLKSAREAAELTQVEVAARAATSQSAVAAYERGRRVPTIPILERLLAASGMQLRVELERLDADLDRRIDAALAQSHTERLRRLRVDVLGLTERLTTYDVPYVIEGAAAAAVHGVPVDVDWLRLVVLDDDAALKRMGDAWFRWVMRRWRDDAPGGWVSEPVSPVGLRGEAETRWGSAFGNIVVRLTAQLPECVMIAVDGVALPVVPLPAVEPRSPAEEHLFARVRSRLLTARDEA